MVRNRFGTPCRNCSVFVLPGGGLLEHDEYAGWEVTCPICEDLDRQATAPGSEEERLRLPAVVPSGCARTIKVNVMGLHRSCWKCGQDTVCIVGFLPANRSDVFDGGPAGDDEIGLALARRLLATAGRTALANSIAVRHSRTTGNSSLSNGCQHCGALQGAFPVSEDLTALLASLGVDALDLLATAELPTLDWIALLNRYEVDLPTRLTAP